MLASVISCVRVCAHVRALRVRVRVALPQLCNPVFDLGDEVGGKLFGGIEDHARTLHTIWTLSVPRAGPLYILFSVERAQWHEMYALFLQASLHQVYRDSIRSYRCPAQPDQQTLGL